MSSYIFDAELFLELQLVRVREHGYCSTFSSASGRMSQRTWQPGNRESQGETDSNYIAIIIIIIVIIIVCHVSYTNGGNTPDLHSEST
jgi:hypothetical protein